MSPITIIFKKKISKFIICVDFKKLNTSTKKDPYPLPFTYDILNTIVGHDAYSFIDGYYGYH
jgi:hypothetical protein